jgi:glycosyltransferase involved in cell wall biosynthesis
MKKKKKVAIIGTNGIPARYGGFETLAENLTLHLNSKYDFTVYCSKKQKTGLKEHNNSKLVPLPLNANGWQSILFDFLSMLHAWHTANIILVLGPTAGLFFFLNKIFKKKIIVNHGGLNEWERKKLSKIQSKISYLNQKYGALYSTYSIADNTILGKNIEQTFGKKAMIIRYGGDHVRRFPVSNIELEKYPFLNTSYAISVSRAQIDNNLHMVLEAFENIDNLKLVMISNWEVSNYGVKLKEKYKNHKNIVLLDAIYNSAELNLLRGNAKIYIHSHSQCGTAPSLVEAMCLKLPIISFNVPTNRETTHDKASYFSCSDELKTIITSITENEIEKIKFDMIRIANANYRWEIISKQYSKLFDN